MWLAWALIAFGAAVRLRLFAAGRAYWSDEAALALNLVNRSLLELLRPLDYHQTAPPLFLWLERVVLLVAGPAEHAMRAIPFIAGVATLVVMWRVGKRLLPDDAALVTLALVAFSPLLIYYSNELKPYSIDALVSASLIALTLRVVDKVGDGSRWRWLALGGALGALLSTTAPFTMAGVAVCLVFSPRARGTRGVGRSAIMLFVVWGLTAAVVLLFHRDVMSRGSGTGEFMQRYWGAAFLTNDPPGFRMRLWTATFGALKTTFIDSASRGHELLLLVLVAALGFWRLIARNGFAIGALVAVPFVGLAVAAVLRLYPFDSRLILFAAPFTALLLAGGITWPGSAISTQISLRIGFAVTAVLTGILLVLPARQAVSTLITPEGKYEVRSLIQAVDRTRDADPNAGPVWVSAGVELPWRFYAGDSARGLAREPRLPAAGTGTPVAPGVWAGDWWHSGDRGRAEAERLRSAANGGCGWFIFVMGNDEERNSVMRGVTELGGRVVETREAAKAASYRACFGGSTAGPTRPAASASLVVLGTGTPNADPDRSGPALAVVVNDTPYLIDAGAGVVRRAAAAERAGVAGLAPSKLATVFITHLHSDHTVGLPDLIYTPWVLERPVPLRVYGPRGIRSMVDHLERAFTEDVRVRTEGAEPANTTGYRAMSQAIDTGVVYRDSNVVVRAFTVPHGDWSVAYGYRFDAGGRSIVISGDTRASEAVVRECNGCDVLVHEVYSADRFKTRPADWQRYHAAAHTSTTELAGLAQRARPKLLVLYHQLYWGADDDALIREIRAAGYTGDVVSARDLGRY
jgi:ribonuclease BN (tRNA processing enzyme)